MPFRGYSNSRLEMAIIEAIKISDGPGLEPARAMFGNRLRKWRMDRDSNPGGTFRPLAP